MPLQLPAPRKPKLYFCVGYQRSGKSTYCDRWVRGIEMPEDYELPRAIWCSDSLRLALHGQRYNKYAEPIIFSIKQMAIRALLNRGFDTIVDGTHTTKESIARILEVDINATPILIKTPPHVCRQRAIDTNQVDLIPVIDRISDNWMRLTNFDKRSVEDIVAEVRKEVMDRWANDPPKVIT